ncbi:MAG: hypothetical protein ABIH28_03845 [archaeon]
MGLKRNKKAMFFTLFALVLLSLFLISSTLYIVISDRDSTSKRIETMNGFVFSVEQNLPRQIYISGYREIFLLEKQIADTGEYISELNSKFEELFYNGSISQIEQEIMLGATFSDINNSINEKAKKMNMNADISSPSISFTQEDPWNVKITFNSRLLLKDNAGLASWDKNLEIISYIPIVNFGDPLYIVSTNGKVTNKINKTIYESFEIPNLILHNQKMYYKASTTAPSFLDRLQGINNANENGIESLVYLPALSQQGIAIKDKSCVDYIYFSSNNPAFQPIDGMPSWFKLDIGHLGDYST